MKIIEVIVSAEGDIKIDALNFKGADCTKATKFLEETLGTVAKDVKKPEFNLQSEQGQQAKMGGGV